MPGVVVRHKATGCSGQKLPFHPQWADHVDRTHWGLRMKAWRERDEGG